MEREGAGQRLSEKGRGRQQQQKGEAREDGVKEKRGRDCEKGGERESKMWTEVKKKKLKGGGGKMGRQKRVE